jgi:hypothetical protein
MQLLRLTCSYIQQKLPPKIPTKPFLLDKCVATATVQQSATVLHSYSRPAAQAVHLGHDADRPSLTLASLRVPGANPLNRAFEHRYCRTNVTIMAWTLSKRLEKLFAVFRWTGFTRRRRIAMRLSSAGPAPFFREHK